MIRILGKKIIIPQGESGAFRVKLIDSKGRDIELYKEDRFILRARHSMESDDKFRKESTPILLSIEEEPKLYHIIHLYSSDTDKLLTGDYIYELIFYRDNSKSTVISKSIFTIEESISSLFPEDDLTILGDGLYEEEEDYDEEASLIIFDEDDEDEFIIFEEDEDDILEYYTSIVLSTPLVGNFNAVTHKKLLSIGDESEDDLIII